MKSLKAISAVCAAVMSLTFAGSVCPKSVNMIPVVSVTASAVSESSKIWNGTADISWYNDTKNSFEISTAEQLAGLSQLVRNGNDMSGKLITLTEDITLNDTSNFANWDKEPPKNLWIPIGAYHMDSPAGESLFDTGESSGYTNFAGTFDGAGHKIKGMYCKHDCLAGLFASVSGLVARTVVEDGFVYCSTPEGTSWSAHAGGISADSNQGVFNQCEFSGKVYAERNGYATARDASCVAGGIVGKCNDTGAEFLFISMLTLSFGFIVNPVIIRAFGEEIRNQGIYNCINRGEISAEKGDAGGILGYGNTGEAIKHTLFVENCLNLGKAEYGIVGRAYKFTVSNCFYTNADSSLRVDTAGEMDLDDSINFTTVGMSKKDVAEKLGICFEYKNNEICLNFNPDTSSLPAETPVTTAPATTQPAVTTTVNTSLKPIELDKVSEIYAELPYSSIMNFRWNKVENADGYQFQIAAENDFSDIAYTGNNSDCKERITNLKAGRTYHIRVRAYADREEDRQRFYSDWKEYIFTYPPEFTMWGDVNGDGEFNLSDYTTLKKWLLGEEGAELSNWKNADYITDNKIDVYDLAVMKNYLTDENALPGRCWIVYSESDFGRLRMLRFDAEVGAVMEQTNPWVAACDNSQIENSPYTIYSFENGEWKEIQKGTHTSNNRMSISIKNIADGSGIHASNIDIKLRNGQTVKKTDVDFNKIDFSQYVE